MSGAEMEDKVELPGPAIIKCPKCSQELRLYTHAQARNVVCENCERLFEIREKGLITARHFEKEKVEYLIPLGTQGRLKDVLYQVVGFVKYKERDSDATWREYVLFNPVSGYAFLSEYNGHWNFFQFITDYSHGKAHYKSFTYEGAKFNLFHKYHAQVVYAAGEFFWNIANAVPSYTEYIAPPYIITRIVSNKEISWLLGEHQEPEVIKEAFGIEKPMPQRIDVGATEVFSGGLTFKKIKKISLLAAAALLFMHILIAIFSQEKQLFNTTLLVPKIENRLDPKPIVGPAFTLKSGFFSSSSVEFDLSAPVSNDWFAAGFTLQNNTTMQEFDFDMGVEHYSGYEDGSSWSEGSTHSDLVLSALPDGEYQMFIRPYVSELGKVSDFQIQAEQNVTLWSNFWIVLLLLGIFPALQYFREYTFEKRRWMNSDFSPYNYE